MSATHGEHLSSQCIRTHSRCKVGAGDDVIIYQTDSTNSTSTAHYRRHYARNMGEGGVITIMQCGSPDRSFATGAPPASGSASGGFQDGLHLGLPVTVRRGSSLPGRRLSAGLRRRSSSAALCQLKDMCRQTDLQQLCRQMFCCCTSKTVEQSSSSSETNLH